MKSNINKKYGIDENLAEYTVNENKINSKEFIDDLESYIDNNGTLINFNTSEENLIKYYYNYIISNPNEWIVISAINFPTDKNSTTLLFEIMKKLKENSINFMKVGNKLKIDTYE